MKSIAIIPLEHMGPAILDQIEHGLNLQIKRMFAGPCPIFMNGAVLVNSKNQIARIHTALATRDGWYGAIANMILDDKYCPRHLFVHFSRKLSPN